ncbi:Ger(x)C family spore germination protein [Brevibacillus sp. NRS-1366]|uniref:Ger(x)C family spore germination protein n=1 Tax=Brevibacillus sp. NRS-1366 TaxID=3233899 RepID=UPI003D245C96
MKPFTRLQMLLILVVLGVFPLVFLTGCWSSVELNSRSFVRMILLDKADDGIELTLAFPLANRLIPGQAGTTGEQTGKPYTYITKKGRDIGEAYRLIQSDLSRKITFGQTSVVVIGRELAKAGISQMLEFVAREPRFHINANIFVTTGKALEVTKVPIIFERFLTDILIAYGREHVTLKITTTDCLKALYNGGDMILPLLKVETKTIPSENPRQHDWLGTDGAAIFKEAKLVRTASTDEMRGALWILGQLKDAEVSVQSSTDRKNVNYMINKVKTRIKPTVAGEQTTIYIETRADASLISSESNVDLLDQVERKKLERGIEALIEERMTKAIEKSRKVGADVFHFGSYIDWHYPRQWKMIAPRWREQYSQHVKVVAQAKITIKRLGSVKEPMRVHKTSHMGEKQ